MTTIQPAGVCVPPQAPAQGRPRRNVASVTAGILILIGGILHLLWELPWLVGTWDSVFRSMPRADEVIEPMVDATIHLLLMGIFLPRVDRDDDGCRVGWSGSDHGRSSRPRISQLVDQGSVWAAYCDRRAEHRLRPAGRRMDSHHTRPPRWPAAPGLCAAGTDECCERTRGRDPCVLGLASYLDRGSRHALSGGCLVVLDRRVQSDLCVDILGMDTRRCGHGPRAPRHDMAAGGPLAGHARPRAHGSGLLPRLQAATRSTTCTAGPALHGSAATPRPARLPRAAVHRPAARGDRAARAARSASGLSQCVPGCQALRTWQPGHQ